MLACLCGLVDGVCWLFENSTGCLFVASAKVCLALAAPFLVSVGSFGDILLLPGSVSDRFLLESLILAQDERWRRA